MTTIYLEACSKKGIKPIKEVQSAIENQKKSVLIPSKIQLVNFN